MRVLLLTIAVPLELCAYTDPGSGVLLWQILVGGIVGIMFYARKILAWLKALGRPSKGEQ